MQKPQAIIAQMDKLRVELMYSIIWNIWGKLCEDYWVEEWTDWVVLWDYYVSDGDMVQIVRRNIKEDTAFEYWDYHSLNCTQGWIEEAKNEHWEDFLKTLFLFDKMRKRNKLSEHIELLNILKNRRYFQICWINENWEYTYKDIDKSLVD